MTKPDLMAELAEDLRTMAGGELPDGDGVTMPVVLWAERWLPKITTHHAELEAAVRKAARFGPCLWIQDAHDGSWDTACGNKHVFIEGDSADNLYMHCPYCGGRLIEPNYDAAMHNSAREG
ncbi:hypothetical protein [Frateuria sp.]|uniref:hypothetical protein n=1 Tax=Frateuria sp. TaxID=2211372 RepID=UPI003F809212